MSEINKSLEALHEKFRPIAYKWLRICYDDLGIKLKVTETLRTPERQLQLEGQGASKVKVGWHQYGLALDFAVFDSKTGAFLKDGNREEYYKAGLVAQAFGCIWGGAWVNLRDSGHIEWHPNFTLAQYQAFLAVPHDEGSLPEI